MFLFKCCYWSWFLDSIQRSIQVTYLVPTLCQECCYSPLDIKGHPNSTSFAFVLSEAATLASDKNPESASETSFWTKFGELASRNFDCFLYVHVQTCSQYLLLLNQSPQKGPLPSGLSSHSQRTFCVNRLEIFKILTREMHPKWTAAFLKPLGSALEPDKTDDSSHPRPAAALSTRAGPVSTAFHAAGRINEWRTSDPQYFSPLPLNKHEPEHLTIFLHAYLVLKVGSLTS